MKAPSSLLLVVAIFVAAVIPSSAAADKQLLNKFGSVQYQQGTSAPQPVAPNAAVAIGDKDTAITGANSQAEIQLPDSSRVLVGQNTQVQMTFFDQQPNITTAKFLLYKGKTRFKVEHPGGAKANYTFSTSTGQIAVRGTEGDISLSDTELQVNVYQVSDPKLPVQVTLNNGKSYTLTAGQALVVAVTGAVIAAATVTAVTQPLTSTFSEFGATASNTAAAGAAGAAAAGVAPAAVAGVAAAAVVGGVVAGTTHGNTNQVTPPSSNVSLSTSTLSLARPGSAGTFTATQDGNTSFSAVSADPSVATVTQSSSNGAFTVKDVSGGITTVTVTGANAKTAQLTVNSASGTISPTKTGVAINSANGVASFNVTETGYTGNFRATSGNTAIATVAAGAISTADATSAKSFTVTGVSSGSTSITVKDDNNNVLMPPVGVTVVTGPIILTGHLVFTGAFNEEPPLPLQASEAGFTGNFTATSGDKTVATVAPYSSSTGTFSVTAVGNGNTTITVRDGPVFNHMMSIGVTVSSPTPSPTPTPSPQPSTTCVPIIIQGRHDTARHRGPSQSGTPCPTSSPTSIVPVPRGTVAPPQPHPLGPPPPNAPKPQPAKPAPQKTPVNNVPRPAGPGIPGMQTPPPLPGPPGSKGG
jgi:hypothetical protein